MRRKTIPQPVPKLHVTSPLLGGLGGLLLLFSIVFTACSSPRQVVTEKIVRDTVFHTKVLMDSVYVSHWQLTDRTTDTLLIQQHDTLIKRQRVHDTIYIARIDSVPYPVTIMKREEVPRTLGFIDYLAYGSLFIVLIYCFKKCKGFV